jgi:hypothetical protein
MMNLGIYRPIAILFAVLAVVGYNQDWKCTGILIGIAIGMFLGDVLLTPYKKESADDE